VLQQGDTAQTALVLLNKGDTARSIGVRRYLQAGTWRDALGGASQTVTGLLTAEVPAHGVRVFVLDAQVEQTALQQQLKAAVDDQRARTRRLAK
jgi:hypothetical protein